MTTPQTTEKTTIIRDSDHLHLTIVHPLENIGWLYMHFFKDQLVFASKQCYATKQIAVEEFAKDFDNYFSENPPTPDNDIPKPKKPSTPNINRWWRVWSKV